MSATDPNQVVAELAIQVPPHHVLYSFAFLVSSVSAIISLSFLLPFVLVFSPAHMLSRFPAAVFVCCCRFLSFVSDSLFFFFFRAGPSLDTISAHLIIAPGT